LISPLCFSWRLLIISEWSAITHFFIWFDLIFFFSSYLNKVWKIHLHVYINRFIICKGKIFLYVKTIYLYIIVFEFIAHQFEGLKNHHRNKIQNTHRWTSIIRIYINVFSLKVWHMVHFVRTKNYRSFQQWKKLIE
jgi:hypothetical protein